MPLSLSCRVLAGAFLLLGACAPGGGGVSTAPVALGGFRPEDRVVLGDFSRVGAVAAAFDRVYVVYAEAVGIWRPLERRWEAPRQPPDPAGLRTVVSAAIDPLDNSLWLATRTGWLHYHLEANRWDQGTLTSEPLAIGIEPASQLRGIWFRTRAGWQVVPRIGGLASPGTPPAGLRLGATVDEALRANPAIRVRAADLLLGPRMEQGVFTSAARAAGGAGWYLGTSTRGLAYFDDVGGIPELLTLGLPGALVGALALDEDGVWVATDLDPAHPAAISHVTGDLVTTQMLHGVRATGYPFAAVRAVLAERNALWLATDQGVARLDREGNLIERWTLAHGLPDMRAMAIARHGDRIAVGTMRGLVAIDADGKVDRIDPAFQQPVYGLHARGDTLWLATANGVYAALPRNDVLQVPDGLRGSVPLRTAFYGVGYVADTLVAMTADQLAWRDPATGSWTTGPSLSANVGPLIAFFADARGVWVAGERGAGAARPGGFLQQPVTWPRDLPGTVTSIASGGGWLWVGTRAGLVRFRLSGR